MSGCGAAAQAGQLRVLVTGDDIGLASIIDPLFGSEHFEVYLARADGLGERIARLLPHALLVNIVEPAPAKALWLQKLRADFRAPVVCVLPHATTDEVEDFAALPADDYLFAPVSPNELQSRLRLLLCRERLANAGRGGEAEGSAPGPGRSGQQRPRIRISERERIVYCCGEAVRLPPKQLSLLLLLASDPGRVFTHQEIIASLWPARRRVRLADLQQHVYVLRSKIEPDPACPRHILNVPGYGYRFVE